MLSISIHAPRKGERQDSPHNLPLAYHFNPRSPQGGATKSCGVHQHIFLISIHAPRKGERRASCRTTATWCRFQSTLPARGSDYLHIYSKLSFELFQSTLPARGSDEVTLYKVLAANTISIHAPRKGERLCTERQQHIIIRNFNPRSPQGGATWYIPNFFEPLDISIHAPRKGERPLVKASVPPARLFQSTLPARGSDVFYVAADSKRRIFQSTLPARGSDSTISPSAYFFNYFNPRSPQGGATVAR